MFPLHDNSYAVLKPKYRPRPSRIVTVFQRTVGAVAVVGMGASEKSFPHSAVHYCLFWVII